MRPTVDHEALAAEARAHNSVLHDLWVQLKELRVGALSGCQPDQFDALCDEFSALHDEFESLHERDTAGDLEPSAQHVWRARTKQLTARIDAFARPGSPD
jgi:hypothetical protein